MAAVEYHNPFRPTAGAEPPRIIGRDEIVLEFSEKSFRHHSAVTLSLPFPIWTSTCARIKRRYLSAISIAWGRL